MRGNDAASGKEPLNIFVAAQETTYFLVAESIPKIILANRLPDTRLWDEAKDALTSI